MAGPRDQSVARKRASAAARPRATVLIVDDRSLDRDPLAHALGEARFRAPTLPNATRALVHLERWTEAFDAVVCSSAMSDAEAFARAALTLRPELRLVVLGKGESAPAWLRELGCSGLAYVAIAPSLGPDAVVRALDELLAEAPQPRRSHRVSESAPSGHGSPEVPARAAFEAMPMPCH